MFRDLRAGSTAAISAESRFILVGWALAQRFRRAADGRAKPALRHARQPPADVLGIVRTTLGDEFTGRIDLPPHVPQQHATNTAVVDVIDDAFAIRDGPVLDDVEPVI